MDARRTAVSSLPGGTPVSGGVGDSGGLHRGFNADERSTSAAAVFATDSAALAAASPSLFSLDGSAPFARLSSVQNRDCGLRCVSGSGLPARTKRKPTCTASARHTMATTQAASPLQGAASAFSLWGVRCIPRLTGATALRKTPPMRLSSASSESHPTAMRARPYLNNYLSGQATPSFSSTGTQIRLSHPLRSASAPRYAVPEEGAPKRARSVSPTPPFSASSSASCAAANHVVPVRPFLRPHLPSYRGEGLCERTHAPETTDAGKSSKAHSRLATFTRRAASATQKAVRQRPPAMRMTRSSTLNRPVLLTKDASRAHPGAAYDTSSVASAAAVAGARASPLPSPSVSSGDLCDTKGVSSSETRTCPAAATVQSVYLSRPSPPTPPPRPAGHRRSRRNSLISVKTNSSASFLYHEQNFSPDEEATATLRFFSIMPDLSAAKEEPCCSSPDEDLTMGTSSSVLGGTGNIPFAAQSGSSEAAATPVCGARKGGSDGGDAGGHSHDATNFAGPPPSPHTKGSVYAGGTAGIVARLKERGNAFLLREEFELAIATYTEAIRLDPAHEALWGNRACAFLLSFRYLPAVADCLYVLHIYPGHTKACWRAAKAYAAAYRLVEAKKYYQLAQQACERDGMWRGSASTSRRTASLSSMRSDKGGDETPDGPLARDAAGSSSAEAAGACCRHDSRLLKSQRERQVLAAEEAALEMVETYWQHLRHERWADALAAMDKVLTLASYTGPTAVSWQALRLEALLHLHPKKALSEAEALYRAYPDSLELYPVLAKSIFYDVHDAAATKRCLGLLDEAAEKRCAQNHLLKVHVRYCATQLRERLPADAGKTTAVHMEAWGKLHYLREDSRTAELRHTIEKFARHRDAGNAAYEAGDWDAAASAYTRCLETDRLNHALLAAVYCNRTAVYMQAGRWRDALSDADSAVSLSPQYATAYARRGRVKLYLLAQEYRGQRAVLASCSAAPWTAAMKERLQGYADAAVTDLTRAVELSPTIEHKTQLQQALAQRRAIKASLKPTCETPKSSMPFSSSSASEGERHRGQSAHSPPPHADARRVESAALCELTDQLKLLGLSILAPSAPGEFGRLPEPKVIAKAYREAALRWHPDKWVTATPHEKQQAEQQFKSICVAYQALRERSGVVF
ncbi:TPR repeat family protein [Leishmania donovani]|uniref:TPR repeat family protein n=2 Tax=Leishmania donovani TaxID=5661 RepID=A0A504X8C2_LEIDO|nr:TPR repeat family protein [Leishmania donovani]